MGQFGNQPDFATNDIKVVVPSNTINTTTFLDASVIYIGDNTTLGNELKVIPAGTEGPSTVTDFVSPGYAGSGGTGYTANAAGTAATTTNGVGVGLTLKTAVVSGVITSIAIGTSAGTGYLNGDLITVTGGNANAVFRVVATTGLPTTAQAVTFKGLGTGGFLPVTVDYVLATGTTVAELIAAR